MNDEYLQKRLERAARCLKVLAHPIRLMIIHLLGEGELSVQELEKAVGISQSSVSQHLGLLKDKEILESRRVAQQVFYRLRDAAASATHGHYPGVVLPDGMRARTGATGRRLHLKAKPVCPAGPAAPATFTWKSDRPILLRT